jgi:inner membrane protein
MRTLTHLAFSATVTSAALCTGEPVTVAVGAVCGALPDIDTPNSWTGRLLRPISRIVERGGHRQITHSFVGSAIFAALALPLWFFVDWWLYAAAIIGYSSGWLLDAGSKTGVPALYPRQKRLVFPYDPAFRLATGSLSEKVFGLVCIAALVGVLHINGAGGALASFSNLLGSMSGGVDTYRRYANTHRITADVSGIRQNTQEPVELRGVRVIGHAGDTDLLVEVGEDEILQVGTRPEAHIKAHSLAVHLQERERVAVRSLEIPEPVKVVELLSMLPENCEIFGQLHADEAGSATLRPNVDPLLFHRVQVTQSAEGLATLNLRGCSPAQLRRFRSTIGAGLERGLWVTGSLIVRERR